MKAILFASSPTGSPLGQVLDRPLIQHVVEQLVERGVRQIHVLYNSASSTLPLLLGDGQRWGIRIETTLVPARPAFSDFEALVAQADGMYLLGSIERLAHLPSFKESPVWNTLYFDEEDGVGRWSNWAFLNSSDLPFFATAVAHGSTWREALRANGIQAGKCFLDNASLSSETPRDLLEANKRALDGHYPGLFFTGREREKGVWIARGAKISSSATITAPCYIGCDARIGSECTIGPYAVIAPECIVDRKTSVVSSVVAEQTFLGPELMVSDSCVRHNVIHHVRLNVELHIEEPHIASSLKGSF